MIDHTLRDLTTVVWALGMAARV